MILPNPVHTEAMAVTIGGKVNAEIDVTVEPITNSVSPTFLQNQGVGRLYFWYVLLALFIISLLLIVSKFKIH